LIHNLLSLLLLLSSLEIFEDFPFSDCKSLKIFEEFINELWNLIRTRRKNAWRMNENVFGEEFSAAIVARCQVVIY
jgi:hypothetical protein